MEPQARMTPGEGGRTAGWSVRSRSRSDWLLVGLLAVTLAPAVVVLARVAVLDWEPAGDQAIIVLRMHDAFTAHPPLRGPWSRFGWDHPGPLMFWLGAPALRLGGPSAVLVHLTLVSSASIVATAIAARRLAGTGFAALVTMAMAVLIHSHGVIRLSDPWNPWATVLPLLCFLFTAALAAAKGSRWALVVALVTGSYAAQSHLGNAPVVLATTGAGVIWWCWRRWLRPGRPSLRSRADTSVPEPSRARASSTTSTTPGLVPRLLPGAALLALALALWAGPIVDQITNEPGNIRALVDFARDSPETPPPLQDSLEVAARELGFVPAWLGVHEGVWPVDPAPIWTLLILPVALAIGTVPAIGRYAGSQPQRVELAVYAATIHLAAVVTVTRTTGGLINYVLRWSWPVALMATTVALLPIVDILRRATPPMLRTVRVGAAVLGATVAVVASFASIRVALSDPVMPMAANDPAVRELSRAIRHELPTGSYAFRYRDARQFSAVGTGTGASLARHGYQLDFTPDHATRFGDFRSTGRSDLPYLFVIGKSLRHSWIPPDGAELLVHWDHLSATDRAQTDRIEVRVRRDAGLPVDQMVTVDSVELRTSLVANGADPADVAELHRLESDRDWYEAWLLPAGSPP